MIEYILGAIRVVYACEMVPWRKVLGFKVTVDDKEGTVSMSCEAVIETMFRTYLKGQLTYDAKLPMRDVELEAGEVPPPGDPDRIPYLQMQTETRSLLGLLIWVSIAYPQVSMATNKGCGFMANPSWGVNAFAKHIALHLYQYPVAVKWGGNKNIKSLVLAEPTVKPFTEGAKEYGLHFAADAAPSNTAKGITGGVGMLNGGAIDTISSRQHLASSDMHKAEITAAATVMHRVVPARGVLQEARVPQVQPTPVWIDSASTIFVATNRSAPKKSTWVRRKTEELVECYEQGESDPQKIDECDNFSDPQTKYLVGKVWMRHLHYTHNLKGEPPPAPVKGPKKSKSEEDSTATAFVVAGGDAVTKRKARICVKGNAQVS